MQKKNKKLIKNSLKNKKYKKAKTGKKIKINK